VTDPLLEAIVTEPDDDAARLVWADRTGGERGELVVVQCALAKDDLPREDRRRLRARERELLARHGAAWAKAEGLEGGVFVRGFVERARVSLAVLAERGAELCARVPTLREIELTDTNGDVNRYVGPSPDEEWARIAAQLEAAFAALPPGRIRALSASAVVHVTGDWSDPGETIPRGDAFARIVASAPSLRELSSLSIYDGRIGREAIPHLARLDRLVRLVASNRLGGDGWVELLSAMPRLRCLGAWYGDPHLEGSELAFLLTSREVARLEELDLLSNQLHDVDFERIAGTRSLSNLRRLGLGQARLRGRGIEALARSPHLRGLTHLDLQGVAVDDAALVTLATATFASSLRSLNLGETRISDRSVVTLRAFPRLEHLDVRFAREIKHRIADLAAVIPDVRG
jgi:uncharacterized protein (TIGR02996 family)